MIAVPVGSMNGKVGYDELLNGNFYTPDDLPKEYVPLGNIYQAPPLPKEAQLSEDELELAESTGGFLKRYVAFACGASPMTPTEFHVASGLSAVAIAIARRVHVRVGAQKIYPNLYTLFVGESTLHRKTTGLYILQGLLDRAGMVPTFTLAERQTPEAFTEDMSLSVPRTYDSWTDTAKQAWLQRRSLSAQRGWILDEASHLLDSFSRDYTSGLLPVVLDLYDSKDRGGERQTKSYGSEIIEKAYLNIFGCTTYGAMAEHMSKASHWRNGLFARFALVTSDARTEWQFWPSPIEHPHELINELRYIAFGLFGNPPKAEIVEEQEEGQPKYKRVEVLHAPDNMAIFADGAWQAWERYAKAVSHDMLYKAKGDGSVEDLVFANYGRFPTMLIKVAMLFAVMDARSLPIIIEPKHIYAAQQIVEAWRSSLHKVRAGGRISEQKTKVDEIEAILGKNGDNWTTKRDLLRAMNAAWSDIEQTIKDLEHAGKIEIVAHAPARGPKTEKYRLLSAVAAVQETVILS